LNDYLKENYVDYGLKIDHLLQISRGILYIHNAGKVHRDLHPRNILFNNTPYISDFGMCKSENSEDKEKIYGILPYVAPEVLHDFKYTKAADIYSFGIIMNEFLSEITTPYENTLRDRKLAINIYMHGLIPIISENTPKLFPDLIVKCWDDKVENRPTSKELYQILNTLNREKYNKYSEIYSQIKNCENIRKKNKNSQVIYKNAYRNEIYESISRKLNERISNKIISRSNEVIFIPRSKRRSSNTRGNIYLLQKYSYLYYLLYFAFFRYSSYIGKFT
jgi:serine/threonine protein kinase